MLDVLPSNLPTFYYIGVLYIWTFPTREVTQSQITIPLVNRTY